MNVVVSSCTASIATESVYYANRLVCIPAMDDQMDTVRRVVQSGVGISIDRVFNSVDQMHERMTLLVFNEETYSASVRKHSKILRSSKGITDVATLVESTAVVGCKHLITSRSQLEWHQQRDMDVVTLLLAFLLLSVLLFRTVYIAISHGLRKMHVHVAEYLATKVKRSSDALSTATAGDSDSEGSSLSPSSK